MKKIVWTLLTLFSVSSLSAQTKTDQQIIKNLCGCYEVDFKYAETFAADTAYEFHPRYHASGLEWVVAEEATDKKFVLQHLLLVEGDYIVKHWREDWEFEKNDWWMFNHDATWRHVTGNKKDVAGQWTQSVWEVHDAPRYQGSAKWVNNNGTYYWANTTDAPLPRREYTKRADYNVMQRTNRLSIVDSGWIHEQDNKKVVRKDGAKDFLIAEEKGYNIYTKTDDAKCKKAADYWQQHRAFWSTVRHGWEAAVNNKNNIHLETKYNGKLLYDEFDELEKKKLAEPELKVKVAEILSHYVTPIP